MNAADGRGPVDRTVGHLPRYQLSPRLVDGQTLIFRDDFDQHGDWTPWEPAQAELDRLRADNEALRAEIATLTAEPVRVDISEARRVTPNAALCGHRTEDTK